MPQETWILNGLLVTQDAKRRAIHSHLRIVDGRIAAITSKKPSKISKSATIIDAQGLVVLPGFVQAHVHLCQTLFRNQADDLELLDWLSKRIWVMEAAHTEETLHASALLGIHELLASGTTCILDMGTVRHTNAIYEAVKTSGIRASVGKCLMDHPETTPLGLREATRDALTEAVALHKKWHGTENDRIRVSYAPRFVISCTEKLLKEVALLSREQGALVHTHASENLKEIQMVKQMVNCENVEYLHQLGLTSENLVLAHCIWLKPNEKDILKKTGTHVVHCPSSNMKLASGFAHVPDLRKRGINVALGADGAPCNNNLNMFQEMRLAALIHKPSSGPKAMRAQEVLDMATRDGAKALGWFKDIGSIEVGKKADLIALDLNCPENVLPATLSRKPDPEAIASSIVYSTQPQHLRWTLVDGKTVYSKGKVHTIPTPALMKQVHEAQLKIARTLSRAKSSKVNS
ncbi:MAG: 5'-deoxyadenosine deaminase [Methylotenera sp.]|nr:5'-deoxyadenosine deaminase [Oligoflexia bacterium]